METQFRVLSFLNCLFWAWYWASTKVLLLGLACFSHWMFVSLPFTLISVRDYTANRSWTTTISFCLGVEGLCFIHVIPTASLLFRNWDAETETWKRGERSKVTQSLRSDVPHRSSALYRTYTALHIRQCVKVWQIKSSFPYSHFITDLPNSQLSAPLKDQGTDVGEEEVFCSILWSSFHQPLCCLLLSGRPRIGQGSVCHWPCPQLQDRVHLRGCCAPVASAAWTLAEGWLYANCFRPNRNPLQFLCWGIPWFSSGWDSMLPKQGTPVRSLVR